MKKMTLRQINEEIPLAFVRDWEDPHDPDYFRYLQDLVEELDMEAKTYDGPNEADRIYWVREYEDKYVLVEDDFAGTKPSYVILTFKQLDQLAEQAYQDGE